MFRPFNVFLALLECLDTNNYDDETYNTLFQMASICTTNKYNNFSNAFYEMLPLMLRDYSSELPEHILYNISTAYEHNSLAGCKSFPKRYHSYHHKHPKACILAATFLQMYVLNGHATLNQSIDATIKAFNNFSTLQLKKSTLVDRWHEYKGNIHVALYYFLFKEHANNFNAHRLEILKNIIHLRVIMEEAALIPVDKKNIKPSQEREAFKVILLKKINKVLDKDVLLFIKSEMGEYKSDVFKYQKYEKVDEKNPSTQSN